jgi:hypothetical protein
MGDIVTQSGEVKEQDMSDSFAGLRKQVDHPTQLEAAGFDSSFWIFKLVGISSVLGVSSKEYMKWQLGRVLLVESPYKPYSQDIWSGLQGMHVTLGIPITSSDRT